MLRCDLAQARVVPGEQRGADAAATVLRIEEADLLVHPRAVRFLIPPDAAVADGAPVDFGDEQVARRIAPIEMRVRRRESLRRLDAIVTLAAGGSSDDPSEVRVVVGAPERPEDDTLELLLKLCHAIHSPPRVSGGRPCAWD